MKKVCKYLLVIILFLSIFIFLNRLVSPKYADDLIEGSMTASYYESEKNHDAIFIGDCGVYTNFSPLDMYDETNIKSYVRGNSGQLIWQSYYLLKETLNYETPDFVVLSIDSLRYDESYITEAYNRLMIDQMKWSKEKIDLINVSMNEEESFLSYVFPILRYHSRIGELTSEDINYLFKYKDNTFNGFLVNKNIEPYTSLPYKKELTSYSFPNENINYLNKIVELCKNNNINLVLIKSPVLYPYWYIEYDEYLNNYAKQNNIYYYNLLNDIDDIGIDFSTDTFDGGMHLNLYGATKLSRYFANKLVNDFNLSYEEDESYNNAYKDYLAYIENK